MNQKETNALILSVKDLIKDFAGGKLSRDTARENFLELQETYHRLEKKYLEEPGSDILKSVCHRHNANNFALLSGVYALETDKVESCLYYGDNSVNSGVLQTIKNNIQKIQDDLVIIHADKKNYLHNIYILPLLSSDRKLIFTAVSSSTYFSLDDFRRTAELFREIFITIEREPDIEEINYFKEISEGIKNSINESIDSEHQVKAILFYFNTLDRIFSHHGFEFMLDLSDEIEKIIHSNYNNCECYKLSICEYLLICRIKKESPSIKNPSRLEFICRGVNIPFKTLSLDITEKNPMHILWNGIASFQKAVRMEGRH